MLSLILFFFFFNDTATTEIYTLSLHDALPILAARRPVVAIAVARAGRGPFDRVWSGQHVQPDRAVLQQDGAGDIRRRLCRAGLCRAAGGRALPLAAAARDAGWFGNG